MSGSEPRRKGRAAFITTAALAAISLAIATLAGCDPGGHGPATTTGGGATNRTGDQPAGNSTMLWPEMADCLQEGSRWLSEHNESMKVQWSKSLVGTHLVCAQRHLPSRPNGADPTNCMSRAANEYAKRYDLRLIPTDAWVYAGALCTP